MYVFRPEPTPSEREALERALEQALEDGEAWPSPYVSRWRRAALEEAVGAEDEDAIERT
jgi:hypothetical protein